MGEASKKLKDVEKAEVKKDLKANEALIRESISKDVKEETAQKLVQKAEDDAEEQAKAIAESIKSSVDRAAERESRQEKEKAEVVALTAPSSRELDMDKYWSRRRRFNEQKMMITAKLEG